MRNYRKSELATCLTSKRERPPRIHREELLRATRRGVLRVASSVFAYAGRAWPVAAMLARTFRCGSGKHKEAIAELRRSHSVVEDVGIAVAAGNKTQRSEEDTSELHALAYLVCRLLLFKKKKNKTTYT